MMDINTIASGEDTSARARSGIGKSVPRVEDFRLLTGQGCYSDDWRMKGQAYAIIVRSPHAHARIKRIDVAAARAVPGVLAVLTGADALADGLAPIPARPLSDDPREPRFANSNGAPFKITPQPLLPVDKARFVGEGLAIVVAETVAIARDAAELIEIDYEILPPVVGVTEALRAGAARVWEDRADNLLIDAELGDRKATAAAFALAPHVVKFSTHCQRVTGSPMEPRAALGVYDAAEDRYTLYSGSGGVHRQKDSLAGVLRVAPEKVRVVNREVGGSFGTRNNFTSESGLVCWASKRVGRPVKWTSDRNECFLSDYQGRDLTADAELALGVDGKFLGFRASIVGDVGAHAVSLVSVRKTAALLTGNYRVLLAYVRARAVATNTVPTTSYRSAGRPEAMFVMERLIELASAKLGIEPVELRRRNLPRPEELPWRNAFGLTFDSGDYPAALSRALEIADWRGFAARREAARARGKRLGRAAANYIEVTTGAPRERTEVTVHPEGTVDVVIGTLSSGQGHETSFAQLICEWLGLPHACVRLLQGDTDVASVGGGTQSGRSMRLAGIVIGKACVDILDKARRAASELLEARGEDLVFADGRFSVAGTDRAVHLFDIARAMRDGALPANVNGPLAATGDVTVEHAGFPYGAAACEVEVDADTGEVKLTRYAAVDDVGRAINPMILHGQTHGGATQGIGQALCEQCVVDKASGQVLTGAYMDYAMPRADMLPSFETDIFEIPSPNNLLGIRAGGEGGTTPALAVVIGAICDALREDGVTHIEMPATPFNVWRAIKAARSKSRRAT